MSVLGYHLSFIGRGTTVNENNWARRTRAYCVGCCAVPRHYWCMPFALPPLSLSLTLSLCTAWCAGFLSLPLLLVYGLCLGTAFIGHQCTECTSDTFLHSGASAKRRRILRDTSAAIPTNGHTPVTCGGSAKAIHQQWMERAQKAYTSSNVSQHQGHYSTVGESSGHLSTPV